MWLTVSDRGTCFFLPCGVIVMINLQSMSTSCLSSFDLRSYPINSEGHFTNEGGKVHRAQGYPMLQGLAATVHSHWYRPRVLPGHYGNRQHIQHVNSCLRTGLCLPWMFTAVHIWWWAKLSSSHRTNLRWQRWLLVPCPCHASACTVASINLSYYVSQRLVSLGIKDR